MQLPLLGPTLVKNQLKSQISDLKQVLVACGPPRGHVILVNGEAWTCSFGVEESWVANFQNLRAIFLDSLMKSLCAPFLKIFKLLW